MKSTRPARETVRATETRGAQERKGKAARGENAGERSAAEAAWPVAMSNLAQAIGQANQDLADNGVEARFFNEPLPGSSADTGMEIVLKLNAETATASIALGNDGNADVVFRHSSRHEHKRLQIAAGTVDAWADVLHQLYEIASPPKTYF
jgi:hypothetical protein